MSTEKSISNLYDLLAKSVQQSSTFQQQLLQSLGRIESTLESIARRQGKAHVSTPTSRVPERADLNTTAINTSQIPISREIKDEKPATVTTRRKKQVAVTTGIAIPKTPPGILGPGDVHSPSTRVLALVAYLLNEKYEDRKFGISDNAVTDRLASLRELSRKIYSYLVAYMAESKKTSLRKALEINWSSLPPEIQAKYCEKLERHALRGLQMDIGRCETSWGARSLLQVTACTTKVVSTVERYLKERAERKCEKKKKIPPSSLQKKDSIVNNHTSSSSHTSSTTMSTSTATTDKTASATSNHASTLPEWNAVHQSTAVASHVVPNIVDQATSSTIKGTNTIKQSSVSDNVKGVNYDGNYKLTASIDLMYPNDKALCLNDSLPSKSKTAAITNEAVVETKGTKTSKFVTPPMEAEWTTESTVKSPVEGISSNSALPSTPPQIISPENAPTTIRLPTVITIESDESDDDTKEENNINNKASGNYEQEDERAIVRSFLAMFDENSRKRANPDGVKDETRKKGRIEDDLSGTL